MQRWSDETGRQDVARQRGTVRRASANLTGRSGVLCSAIQQQAPDDGRSRAPTDAFRFIAWSGGVHLSTRARGQAGLSTYTGLVVSPQRAGARHGDQDKAAPHCFESPARLPACVFSLCY
jgi:hypothetical protein